MQIMFRIVFVFFSWSNRFGNISFPRVFVAYTNHHGSHEDRACSHSSTLRFIISWRKCRRVWQAEYSILCYVYPSVCTIGYQQHFKMRRFSFGNCWKSKNSGKWHSCISNPHKDHMNVSLTQYLLALNTMP